MELIKYGAILLVLLLLELLYFRLADRFNIIDKPNQRSSHSRIVLRGGGIIFTIALWLWSIMYGCPYPWLLAGVGQTSKPRWRSLLRKFKGALIDYGQRPPYIKVFV